MIKSRYGRRGGTPSRWRWKDRKGAQRELLLLLLVLLPNSKIFLLLFSQPQIRRSPTRRRRGHGWRGNASRRATCAARRCSTDIDPCARWHGRVRRASWACANGSTRMVRLKTLPGRTLLTVKLPCSSLAGRASWRFASGSSRWARPRISPRRTARAAPLCGSRASAATCL